MYILGLSFDFHDAAVALVRDGQLCSAVEEERFNRRKHSAEFPVRALDYALRREGITPADIDHIGYYEKPLVKFDRVLRSIITTWPASWWAWTRGMPVWLTHRLRIGRTIQRQLSSDRDVVFCEHHMAHAASAFLVSPFEEAAIITADGVGEWTTTAIGVGRDRLITFDSHVRFPHSLGLLFTAITTYLGFKANDAEWKVMGLAPYGQPKYLERLRQVVDVRDDGSFRLDLRYFRHHYSTAGMFTSRFEKLLGRPGRRAETALDDFHADVAASGQKLIEEIMVKIARHAWQLHKVPRLCLAGGVALNCVANWRILQDTPFQEVFIQPAAGDSGGALGTAFHIAHSLLGQPREFVMRHAHWGPEFTTAEIADTLTQVGAKFETLDPDSLLERVAAMIAEGRVVGWFQGRMEYGPRALGARSILADPRSAATKDLINAKVKFRESFRPFAPAVLRQVAHEWFDMPPEMDLPFMLMVPAVRPHQRARIPAVTHHDGTGRVQTLTPAENGRFYKLVETFGRLTGVPILVNTSFNVRGEPIVCTPLDAWRTFVNTGIDALAIGDILVTDKPSPVDYQAGLARSVGLEAGTAAPFTDEE